jgi:hypothetical protein
VSEKEINFIRKFSKKFEEDSRKEKVEKERLFIVSSKEWLFSRLSSLKLE